MNDNTDVTRADGMRVVNGSFPFEVKSGLNGTVRVMAMCDAEPVMGVYLSGQVANVEFNARRWLPIFRELVAKCEEVTARQSVGTLAADLAERIAEHAAAT